MAQAKKSPNSATKTSAKTQKAPKKAAGSKAKKSKRVPTPRFRLSTVLPGKVVEIDAVKQFATKVDEAEALAEFNTALDALQERTVELFESVQGRADALEENARERFEEQLDEVKARAATLREKAQETKAGKLLQELPERATTELDEFLARLGLMRVAAHEEEVEVLRNRYKGLMKAAATKARNQAMKDAKKKFVAKSVSAAD